MAGGTWIQGVEKVRPGLYMNFKIAALERIKSGERGTVTMPLELSWGQSRTFLKIETDSDVLELLGYDINDPKVIKVREAKKRAKTLLIYRLNEGDRAKATFGTDPNVTTATAVHTGIRGNDIAIASEDDPSGAAKKLVKTLVSGRVVDQQLVSSASELKPNAWVTFSGAAGVDKTAGAPLTGGTDAAVKGEDHTAYLEATETQHFDVIAYPFSDPGLKISFISFIKRMREEEGKKIQGVIASPVNNGAFANISDYEGIVSVGNGVVLLDGSSLSALDAVAWVAGATAGASIIQSNTYSAYEGAVDANPRLKNSQVIEALKKGQFVFVHDGVKVKVEQDLNSLVSYSQTRNGRFSKNRVVRVLDAIANDFARVANDSYIGKIDNNGDGHALLKAAANQYLRDLQDAGAIQNVDFIKDFEIDTVRSVGDEVYVNLGIQPVDSMEKFFFTVEVR
ncbi:phage tail sheath family protein [Paenibacillus glycanilyticus]|uniref:phage tail sheath family protein n=1 Tax=Paenibacillus glycanilyticus TaxID=126569 RepID=UPI00203F1620|nr:phage tail sheath family protein [Paenibacillus glycanilyticus]MCM3626876.1 phage tail sheath family protein [Paenibacillus glycanilyticus]